MRRTLIACTIVALVAGGGTAVAASKITSRDIKNGTIKMSDLSRTAKNGLKGKRGLRGFTGPAGPQGPAGVSGVLGAQVVEVAMTIFPGEVNGPQAFCPAGKVVIGTGYFAGIAHPGFVKVFGNSVGAGYINDSSIAIDTSVQAICGYASATAGVARVASASKVARQFDHALSALKADREP